MKFSEKGLKRLLDVAFDGDEFYQYDALQINFYPEDFKGAVVLPIDEAKVLFEALLRLPVEGNKAVLKKTLIPLKWRIEQAEKGNETK